MAPVREVYQFKITLAGIEPPIWRRIQVPERYSFFDLHVAIQSAMGWEDRHLHAFRFPTIGGRKVEIGIPVPDPISERRSDIPGWKIEIGAFFDKPGDRAEYEYDFGEGWKHEVVLEAIVPRVANAKYPVCLAGERACPPEDCGGAPGYLDLLRIMGDPSDEQYEDMLEWLELEFNPEFFEPAIVRFSNPRPRLKRLLEELRSG